MKQQEKITIERTVYWDDETHTRYIIDRNPRTYVCAAWMEYTPPASSRHQLHLIGTTQQEEKARGMIEAHAERQHEDIRALRPKENTSWTDSPSSSRSSASAEAPVSDSQQRP